jgi:DNA-binding MltR family transcriptional regulator
MSKNLSHHDWIIQQFEEKYLKISYRDVLIHSSIIEGVLVKESGVDKFDLANKFLLCSGKISASEFCAFDEIRKIRNRLAHDIFKKSLAQEEIDKLRDDLMRKIHKAYKISTFLDANLFQRYQIARQPSIKLVDISQRDI